TTPTPVESTSLHTNYKKFNTTLRLTRTNLLLMPNMIKELIKINWLRAGLVQNERLSLLKIIATIADDRWRKVSRYQAAIQASIESAQPRLSACIRLMFQAMVTRLHSPRTPSSPRSRNWRNPITDLMMPNTGSGVCLRRL